MSERKRRADGERTRQEILAASARLATLEGLQGLSIGRLAETTGMSKGGLYAHFGSKEVLQLATVDAARTLFVETVVTDALRQPPGRERLLALCEAFLRYVEERVFPGGCFFAAAAAEVGAQPGRLQERIAEYQRQWMGLLTEEATRAREQGELADATSAAQLAFELNALLVAANTAFILQGNTEPLARAREGVRARLAKAAHPGA